jgi:23S rRNA (cytosine1962-C5)-methyltransferase
MKDRAATLEVRVSPRGARRLASGHPWVFRDDVAPPAGAGNGDLLRVLSPRGEALGYAFYSTASKIALRAVRREDEPPGRSFWESRLDAALEYRGRFVADGTARRIIFGESDGFPGVVADLYGTHLIVQALTAGSERLLGELLDLVSARIPIESVLARNDPAVRALEGLPREVRQLRGETPPEIEVSEGAVRYVVDCFHGQKTGAFLDQRENRIAAARFAGGRCLDVFCYQGLFSLHAARRGGEVEAIDVSRDAISRAEANARANDLSNVRFEAGNAFDALRDRDRRGERYDLVILDPPAFAKSRSDVNEARRGYKEVNLRAMRLLRRGGVLVTSSCSYHMGETVFVELLAEAAADVGRQFRLVETRTQSRDHPVRLGFPESRYLKCVVLSLM